jgi:acyl dehydratase
MSKTLPLNGPLTLGRAVLTVGRKAKPLGESFTLQYECEGVNNEHVQMYKDFVGFTNEHCIPLSYFYLLAQRAQLSIMMDRRFTYPVPGLVHMANSMQIISPIDAELPMDLRITATQEPIDQTGRLCILFDVVIEQSGTPRISCTSRYLGKKGSKKDSTKPALQPQLNLEKITDWSLPGDTGRRYAALSGDYNPIHLWPWSARLFGFKEPIAHGMYSIAKAQSFIEKSLGDQVTSLEATFIKPTSLPGQVRLELGEKNFRLIASEQIVALGRFDTARPQTV